MAEQSNRKVEEIPPITSKIKILRGDKVIWIIIVILFAISFLVVYSSFAKMGYSQSTGFTASHLLSKHIMIIFLSVVILLGTYKLSCNTIRMVTIWFYWIAVVATIYAYFFGQVINGASRSLSIFGFSFQPSEMLKVGIIAFLANQLSRYQKDIRSLKLLPSFRVWTWTKRELKEIACGGVWHIVLPLLLACGVIAPAHSSSAVLVFFIGVLMLIIARVRFWQIFKLVILLSLFASIYLLSGTGRSGVMKGRTTTYIEYWTNEYLPKSASQMDDTDCAMVAMYNGGLIGVGAGRSTMRYRITHPESDYLYAFFIEEYGFLLGIFLLFVYMWVFIRSFIILKQCKWVYAGLLEMGMALLIVIQAFIHMAVSVYLLPETGQNLPLVSHGGTSMIFMAMAFGIILSVSRQVENGDLEAIATQTIEQWRE